MEANYQVIETEFGKLPVHWKIIRLGDMIYVKGRIVWEGLKKSEYTETGYPIFNRMQFVNDKLLWENCGRISEEKYLESPEIMLQKNDILMTKDDSIGKLAFVDELREPATVASGVFVIRSTTKILNQKYLFYFFKSEYFRQLINSRIEGSVVPHLYQRDFIEMKMPLPPLSEQIIIIKILDLNTRKIEVNHRMNEVLEQMAQAIFKSWFVDFEPFRDPQHELYMGEDGFVYNEELDKEIPKGWEMTNIGKVTHNYDRLRVPLSKRKRAKRQGIYPYHDATSIMDYIDEYLFDGIYLLVAEDGSIIDENDRPVLQYVHGKFWVNNHAHVITGKENISTEFILLSLQHINIKPYITGAVQLKINQSNLNRIPVITANKDIHKRFQNIINPIYTKIRLNKEQIIYLLKLRDLLLAQLISGRLRIPDPEKFLEELENV